MSIQQEVGRNIVFFRKKRGITQEILALDAEVSVSYLRTVEHGEANPTLEFISKLANILKVRTEILLTPGATSADLPVEDESDYVSIPTSEYLFVSRALSFIICADCQNKIEKERQNIPLPSNVDKGTEVSFIDEIIMSWRNTHDDLQSTHRQTHR